MARIYPELLPAGYYLEEDTAVLYLRRDDGTTVATFSTSGATRDSILEVVFQDHRVRS
jgi:hypothetical protein